MGIPVELVGGGIDWPAWFQAVGSVLGIGLAITIPTWQRHKAKQDVREAAVTASYDLVRWLFAASAMKPDSALFREQRRFGFPERAVALADSALASVPLHDLGSGKAVGNVMGLRSIASNVLASCMVQPPLADADLVAILRRSGEAAVAEFEDLAKQLNRTRNFDREQIIKEVGVFWPR